MPNIEKLEGDGGNHVLSAGIHISKHEAQRPDFEQLLDAKLADLRRAVLAAVAVAGWRELQTGPALLNAEQVAAAKTWAADDRLWTTQETVEFNLRVFARVILAAGGWR